MHTVSIVGLNKADVLAALYNASRPQGMGFLHYNPTPMTREQAQAILDRDQTNFDYLSGRVMKLDLSSDDVNVWAYDRDNGAGTAERAINSLREQGDANSVDIQTIHKSGKTVAAENLQRHLHEETRISVKNGVARAHIGFSDVAEHLRPAIDKALKD